MVSIRFSLFLILLCLASIANAQALQDDFEGNGNVGPWSAIDISLNTNYVNPVANGINTSATVMGYFDDGRPWNNVYFDAPQNFNLAAHPDFSLKIYVPSNSISGSQDNVVTLKLQNSKLLKPWESQTLIHQPIVLDQWQEVHFNFQTDAYENFDANSPAPIERRDFDRVLLQVNGENNSDLVVAYIDDFFHANSTPLPPPPIYDELLWSDEFNGNGPLHQNKWHHQTQFPIGTSWFSGEIQHYTNRIDNSYMENGVLRIVAKKENYSNHGVSKAYTSARINSKFAFTYGRVEVRAKLPSGVGTWPAIWMLGKNINERGAYFQTQGFGTVTWPYCGEMDIMEHWGNNQDQVTSAVHNPMTYFGTPGTFINSGGQVIPNVSSTFHTYALNWTPDKLEFSTDGVIQYIYQPPVKTADNWPFDLPHYVLMNIAIQPIIDPNFTESSMEVDYIRIYEESSLGIGDRKPKNTLKVYPNPVEDQISILLNTQMAGMVDFEIYAMNGALVFAQSAMVENGLARINGLSALPKGVYVLRYARDGNFGSAMMVR